MSIKFICCWFRIILALKISSNIASFYASGYVCDRCVRTLLQSVTEGGPSPKTSVTKGAAIHCTTSGSLRSCGDGRGDRYHLWVYCHDSASSVPESRDSSHQQVPTSRNIHNTKIHNTITRCTGNSLGSLSIRRERLDVMFSSIKITLSFND